MAQTGQIGQSIGPGLNFKMDGHMARVFICYRRQDSEAYASALRHEIERRFGSNSVFQDINSVMSGSHFPTEIKARLSESDVVFVLIGRRWLVAEDGAGSRLHDPDDWVRHEIREALRLGKRVVPVLVQGAQMPKPGDLPDDIRRVAELNGYVLSNVAADGVRLCDIVEQRMSVLEPAAIMALAAGVGAALRSGLRNAVSNGVTLQEFEPGSLAVVRWFFDLAGISLQYPILLLGLLLALRVRTGWRLEEIFRVVACAALGVAAAHAVVSPLIKDVPPQHVMLGTIKLCFWFTGLAAGTAIGIDAFASSLQIRRSQWLKIGAGLVAFATLGSLLQVGFFQLPNLSSWTNNPRTLFWGPVFFGTSMLWMALTSTRRMPARTWLLHLILPVLLGMLFADLLSAATQPFRAASLTPAGAQVVAAKQALDSALFFGIVAGLAVWRINRMAIQAA